MSGYGDERGARARAMRTESTERAAKPLASALDTTLSILMDERIAGFSEKFHSMSRSIDTLNERVAALEEEDWVSPVIDERLAAAAAQHMSETERLIKEEFEGVQLKIEGKADLDSLKQLEEQVDEMEKVFKVEVDKRHNEVHEINEVLKGLEMLFETRDEEYADERRHKIESQLRKTIFHIKRKNATAAFNQWRERARKSKRARHLTMMSVAQWRNRHLAMYWRPWLNHFRHEHRTRANAAMEILDKHAASTQLLEDKVHSLTGRIEQDLLTDQDMQEHLEQIRSELHEKEQGLTRQMQDHAAHLNDWLDSGHAESIAAMEAKLDQKSDALLERIRDHAGEVEEKFKRNKDELKLINASLDHSLGLSICDAEDDEHHHRVERTKEQFHKKFEEEAPVMIMQHTYAAAPPGNTKSTPPVVIAQAQAPMFAPKRRSMEARPNAIQTSGSVVDRLNDLAKRMRAMEAKEAEALQQVQDDLIERVQTTCGEEIEHLEVRLEEIDAIFQKEVDKRHNEVHEINEALKGLEMLFETRDEEYADERRHKIESQLRKTIFHIKRKNATAAFNQWRERARKSKRARHLTMMSVAQWRNRHLAMYWRPWLNHFRHEHRTRANAAMEILDKHAASTQLLEDKVHSLTGRIEQDLLTDQAMQKHLEQIRSELHEKEQGLTRQMQDHAAHLREQLDDGHGNMSKDIETMEGKMEAKLQQKSDELLQNLEVRARELELMQDSMEHCLGLSICKNKEDEHSDRLHRTHKEFTDKFKEDAPMNPVQSTRKVEHVTQPQPVLKTYTAQPTTSAGRGATPVVAVKQQSSEASSGTLIDQFERLRTRVRAVEEKGEQVDDHDTTLKRILKELGIKDIHSYEAAGAVRGLIQSHIDKSFTEHNRYRKKMHIEKLLRHVIARWTHSNLAAALDAWNKHAKARKRTRNLAKKCVNRIEHVTIAHAILPWLREARAFEDKRHGLALKTLTARAEELKLGLSSTADHHQATMDKQREAWIEIKLRRVLAQWSKGLLKSVFDSWGKHTFHVLKTRNLMSKAVMIMENCAVHQVFKPWLSAARQRKDEKILAHTYAIHDETVTRLDGLEKHHGEKHETIVQNVADMTGQLSAMHAKLEELGHIGDVDRVQKEIEDRLEHLEISLREEFQHVEVRCDIVSREFNRLCGKEWKDGLPPNKQPLDGLFAAESSAGRQLKELQEGMGVLKKETELLREFMSADRQGGEEGLDSLWTSVRAVEGSVQRLSELKASVESLQQQTNSVRSKQVDTSETLAAQHGEVGGLKTQLDTLATTVSSQAAASIEMVELKAGVSSIERELSTVRNEQQQRAVKEADDSATIAGIKAELNMLQQAHMQTQNVTHEIQTIMGDMRVLQSNVSGLDGKVKRVVEQQEQVVAREQIEEVAREQVEAAVAAQFDAQQVEEGDPPTSPRTSGSMIDELGYVTRTIATLQLEQEVLSRTVDDNPDAAKRLGEVVQELSALEGALDQLGAQVGMDQSPAPSEYDEDEVYDGGEDYEYARDDDNPSPARQLSSRRRPDRLRAARSRPSGPTDREAAWARAHAHAFGRASMRQDDG